MTSPRMSGLIRGVASGALACALMISTLPATVDAQEGVRTVQSIDMEFGGGMGAMMGGMQQEIPDETVTYFRGSMMRSDQGSVTTIFDYASGSMTVLNHDDQTYYSGALSEMMEMGMMEEGLSEEEIAEMQAMMEGIMNSMDVEFSIQPTGETMSFDGYDAEKLYMTMSMNMGAMAEASNDPEMAMMAQMMGNMNMVYFAEMWMSRDHPAWEIQEELGEAIMDVMQNSAAPAMNMLGAFMGEGGNMWEMLDMSEEEMEQMMGMQVQTTALMYFVTGGQEFDQDVAMGHLEGELPDGGLGAMMGGLMGGGGGGDLSPLMRMTQTVTETEIMDVPDSMFEVPEGYTNMQTAGGNMGVQGERLMPAA